MLSKVVVLIAEDEPLISIDLESAVLAAGGQVRGPAASVLHLHSLIDANDFDIALLDFNLIDGDTQALAIGLINKQIPIVFNTGVALPSQFMNAYPDVPVFAKPTTMATLMKSLRTELDNAAGYLSDFLGPPHPSR